MQPRLLLNLLTACALGCASLLVFVMLLRAPMVLAWAAIVLFQMLFAVLVVQLVTSQRLPARDIDSKPAVIVHEDGSIEVQR